MSNQGKADRIATLRAEITERVAELKTLIQERRHAILAEGEFIIVRECSRAYNEAIKEEAGEVSAEEPPRVTESTPWIGEMREDENGRAIVKWAFIQGMTPEAARQAVQEVLDAKEARIGK